MISVRLWLRHWYLERLQAHILRLRRRGAPEWKVQVYVERHDRLLTKQLADRRAKGIVEIKNQVLFDGYITKND